MPRRSRSPKLTATQQAVLLHLYRHDLKIVDNYASGTGPRCEMINGREMPVRFDTLDALTDAGLLTGRFSDRKEVWRLSPIAQQLISLTF